MNLISRQLYLNRVSSLKNGYHLISKKSMSTNNLKVAEPSAHQSIVDKCLAVRASLQTISDRCKGPLEKSSQKNTVLPFVFLLGNHSSGKSSFINYVIQRKVQVTGVAPTDDCFTIIVPGPSDVDRDGPAFIGDPDMGFAGLKTFGPQLIHHTQLKVRGNTAIQDFMIVDTPGMIDSPTPRTTAGPLSSSRSSSRGGYSPSSSSAAHLQDRGYDFEGVCRWYAERADVILLFFDPDKPGTTGETLSILTNSLVGLEHKLHIVLNKADQFRKIHDFARAYGSLCWNLSKVIQRKDLPRIYTMCLPTTFHAVSSSHISDVNNNNNENSTNSSNESSLGRGVIDLEAAREEVVAEVFNAPKRRVDNEVSRLADSAAALQMHVRIITDITTQYRRARRWSLATLTAGWLTSVGTPVGMMLVLGLPLDIAGTAGACAAVGMGVTTALQSRGLNQLAERLSSHDELDRTFRRLYARKIAERDEDTQSLWSHRVSDVLHNSITARDIQALSPPSHTDRQMLERIIEEDIPNLRRAIGPAYNRQ